MDESKNSSTEVMRNLILNQDIKILKKTRLKWLNIFLLKKVMKFLTKKKKHGKMGDLFVVASRKLSCPIILIGKRGKSWLLWLTIWKGLNEWIRIKKRVFFFNIIFFLKKQEPNKMRNVESKMGVSIKIVIKKKKKKKVGFDVSKLPWNWGGSSSFIQIQSQSAKAD